MGIKQSGPKGPSRFSYRDTKDRLDLVLRGRKTKIEADEILSSSCIGNLRGRNGKNVEKRDSLCRTRCTRIHKRVFSGILEFAQVAVSSELLEAQLTKRRIMLMDHRRSRRLVG